MKAQSWRRNVLFYGR